MLGLVPLRPHVVISGTWSAKRLIGCMDDNFPISIIILPHRAYFSFIGHVSELYTFITWLIR